jgi:hypothetical protein
VPEGDPEDWVEVVWVISGRGRELGWRQREFAVRSRVSARIALLGRLMSRRACR